MIDIPPDAEVVPLIVYKDVGKELVRIDGDGRIYWHGREVKTDEQFRGAMLAAMQALAAGAEAKVNATAPN
jgi:hypothetical protein